MQFEPNSILYVGNVPFDNSYNYVRLFGNKTEQANYFANTLDNYFSREDYTYIRTDGTIKVDYNAESLYHVNYCMFKNANYGDKWFYAFVTNIEYINENTTKLTLSIDLFQTWFLDCSLNACTVLREHVNSDTIGEHLLDEGLELGELICTNTVTDESETYPTIIVSSAVEPNKDGTYTNNKGDVYFNMPSGTALTAFRINYDLAEFGSFMQALSDNGQQDAVNAVYVVPHGCLPELVDKPNGYGWWVKGGADVKVIERFITWNLGGNTLDGYTPRNKKLLCFPYQYFELTDFTGNQTQLRLEFFETHGTITLNRMGGVDQNSNLMYIPTNYNGIEWFVDGALTLNPYAGCSWVYQASDNYKGSTKFNVVQYDERTGLGVDSFETNAVDILTLKTMVSSLNPLSVIENGINNEIERAQKTRLPNTVKGGTNSSVSLVNLSMFKGGVRLYTIREEFAKCADDWLDKWGYSVKQIKSPNITGRNSWNYVRTNGMMLKGSIPTPALKFLNSMFDRGVTFWHTNDVGNYGLSNHII